jgi:hypothetical protein
MEDWMVCRPVSQIRISLLMIYVLLLLYITLKGLCHEMDFFLMTCMVSYRPGDAANF